VTREYGRGVFGVHVAFDAAVQGRIVALGLVLVALTGLSTFLIAAQHSGAPPVGDFVARKRLEWHIVGPDAERRRREMLLKASVRLPPEVAPFPGVDDSISGDSVSGDVTCRFVNDPPSGTTSKFNCVLDGGIVIKVKYGRNPEIQGEVAGTRLLRSMGFPADDVAIVPRLRCYGCPRDPFVTAVAGSWTSTRGLLGPTGFDNGYTDFEWASIEHKFPAPAIETDTRKGWAWWEIRNSTTRRADLDALRLLAVFMAHWDNKSENQRLVCLDGPAPSPPPDCARPLAMIQDLGATFGPTKVNIGRWPSAPIWADPETCMVTMRSFPWKGGTFPDVQISEDGRRLLAHGLEAITEEEIREIFQDARFPQFQTATEDEADLQEWVAAFRTRTRQIADAGPCPAS
jgi:hypothetical protein